MKKINLLAFLGLFLISGCGLWNESRKSAGISRQQLYTVRDTSTGTILPTLFWSHYDATQRGGIYLVSADGSVKVISENPPDAAINSTIDALVKAEVGNNVDAAAKFTAIKAVAELGHRNAGNYMIRDLAFRIEALKNNHNEEIDDNVIEIYKNLISSAENISIAESKNKIYESKAKALEELKLIIKMSKDSVYKDLKLDSTFIRKLGELIEIK
jgi:hypothetical protein